MKSVKYIFLSITLFLFLNLLSASEPYCSNLGFEQKNFTNWTGYTWVDKQDGTYTPPVAGFLTNRHEIITTQGYDATVGGNILKMIPDGFTASAKLGSTYRGNGGLHQSLLYDLDVSSENALIIMHFAVVLHDPNNADHQTIDEPRFKLTIYDENGNLIPDCANYDVYASNARVGGWQRRVYSNSGGTPVYLYWRDWTAVGINLSSYIGKKITIEFMSANCRRSGHFGYAYFAAECLPMDITVDYCRGNTYAKLNAPFGFEFYEWRNAENVAVGNERTLTINNPAEGDRYSCSLISATGCEITLNTTVYRYEPNAAFAHDRIDCNNLNNTLRFYVNELPTHGKLEYHWNFGDGTTSTEAQPVHQFVSVSGWVKVKLKVTNPPSSCIDTFSKMVETFYPPLVKILGDSTYCPGGTTTLKGYGADHYVWKLNGNIISWDDSVTVAAPGGLLELTGFTSGEECSTSKYKTIIEEPDWEFTATADTYFCKYQSVTLNSQGAISYQWDNLNSTSSSVMVNKPGIYTVKGKNKRGCEKSISINVREIDLPKTGFTVMPELIDSRHNEIQCFVPQETDVNYYWDFGDGNEDAMKNTVQHKYTGLTQLNELKTITLRAVNEYGCDSVAYRTVVVGPFFPNVFTPNADGINDKYLAGIDVLITDRYGLVVYKGNEGWNGKFGNSGKDLPPDTYFFHATYTDPYGTPKTRKGFVTLIR